MTKEYNQPDDMTVQKAAEVCGKGYQITGYILENPETGDRCFVEKSAVRWLDRDSMQDLMHPVKS